MFDTACLAHKLFSFNLIDTPASRNTSNHWFDGYPTFQFVTHIYAIVAGDKKVRPIRVSLVEQTAMFIIIAHIILVYAVVCSV